MTYDAFLDTVQERLDLAERDDASALTMIVLETFSEILYRTERDKASAPLPKELTRYLHAAKPEQSREKVERLNAATFLDRVQARADLNREDAETATTTVLSVLQEAAGDTVLSNLGDSLPPSYAEIFPFMSHSDADTTE